MQGTLELIEKIGLWYKLAVAAILMLGVAAIAQSKRDMAKIYDFKALNNKGAEVDFSQYDGKVLLIVNTASKCGFTPQYDGLEALYQKYKDRGLVVIGFPCDQFAHQEPGSDEEIAEFCRLNHGVTFPLMSKIDVNGESEHPVFTFLKAAAPTEEYKGFKAKATQKLFNKISSSVTKDSDIKWNFTKFLIARDGSTVTRFAPTTKPEDIDSKIAKLL